VLSVTRALVGASASFGTGKPSTAGQEHGLGVPIRGPHPLPTGAQAIRRRRKLAGRNG
jgi:hypothetical protein